MDELGGVTHAAWLAISEGWATAETLPMCSELGSYDRARDGLPRLAGPDAHTVKEMPVHEVGRAIERIAIPSEPTRSRWRAALLFGDNRNFRGALAEQLSDQPLAREVVLRHEIRATLFA